MKMKFKIMTVLALYGMVLVWDGCSSLVTDCNCPEINLEFTDYKGFEVAINNPEIEIDSVNTPSFEILLTVDSVFLIAQHVSSGFGLLSPAYGCSCLGEGFRGDKFPVVAIDVFSDHPFKSDYIPETNLNHIFEIDAFDNTGQPAFQIINEVNQFPRLANEGGRLHLRTNETPDSIGTDISYRFDVVITKSDGTILTVTTEEVRWL